MRSSIAFVLVGILLIVSPIVSYGCTNHEGKEVDWFVSFRLSNSRRYLIFQSDRKEFIETDEKLLEKVVSRLSFTKDKILIWNDQTVDDVASLVKAHSKGFLHYQENKTGFLLLHSIPHFIDTTGQKFKYETRETSSYGQSIVCVTISDPKKVQTVIDHVVAQYSNIYEDTFGLPKREKPKVPSMVAEMPHGFTLITKTSESDDLHPFEDIMVGHFKTGWLVNTWSRPYKEDSCSTSSHIVSNIIFKNLGGQVTKSTQDHSKWALSYGDKRRIVCVGDLNHMNSQMKRGGSFLCIDDDTLYKTIYSYLLNDSCQIVQNFSP